MNTIYKKLSETLVNDTEKLYIKEVMSIPLLNVQEEKKLLKMAKEGDLNAKEKIIISNLRLVIAIANRYLNMGIPFMDLVSEGNFGLFTAFEKYDYTRGVKFATYATYWINNYIYKCFAKNDKLISVPPEQYYKILAYRKALGALTLKLHHTPSREEITDELGILDIEIEEIERIETINNMINIDETIGEMNNKNIESILDSCEEPFEEKIIDGTLTEYVDELFNNCNLSDYEKNILRLRYGFLDDKIYSYVEIGKMYNVTRQRIQQVERRAIKKMRLLDDIVDFVDYAERPEETLKFLSSFRDKYYHKKLKKNNT